MVIRVPVDRIERMPAGASPIHSSSPEAVLPTDARYALFRMNEVLAKIEGFIPDSIHHYSSSTFRPPVALVGDNADLQYTYREWIDHAQSLLNSQPDTPETTQERALLAQQILALRYRIGYFTEEQRKVNASARELYFKADGSLRLEHRDARLDLLSEVILRYKASTSIYPRPQDAPAPELTPRDLQQLMRACRTYPHFVDLLISRNQDGANDRLTIDFVKFCLRSGCSVSVFVMTPNERLTLSEAHLDKRTGGVEGRLGVRFKRLDPMKDDSPRVVSMRMHVRTAGLAPEQGRYVPIQGPQSKERRVGLPNLVDANAYGDLELTVGEVFKQFKAKTTVYGNVEYVYGKGVVNLCTIDIGSYDSRSGTIIPIALSGPDFVGRSPTRQRVEILNRLPCLTVLTQEELTARYPGQKVPERAGEFGFAVRATRLRPNFDVLDAHAYAELVVRQANGTYKIYPFGMQPKEFPDCVCTKLASVAATDEAGIHFVDESGIASHRQAAGVMHVLDENTFDDLVIDVRDFILEGRNGNLVFQPLGENCGHFVMKLVYKFITGRLREPLYTVACNTMQGWDQNEIKRLVERALFYFDEVALNTLLDTIFASTFGSTLTTQDLHNLYLLMDGAVDLLGVTVMKDVAWNSDEIKNQIRTALTSFQDATLTPEARAEAISRFKEDFKTMIGFAVRGQQYYRMPIFEADFSNPIFNFAMTAINSIPWIWLRDAIYNFVMFVFLWSFRSRTIQEPVSKTQEVATQPISKSVSSSGYWSKKTLNLPASLFGYMDRRDDMLASVQARVDAIRSTEFRHSASEIPDGLSLVG